MEDRLREAITLARIAGAIIKDSFGKQHTVELKDDRSPVTKIDRQINRLVAKTLRATFPDDCLLGEEESYGTGNEKYQWICDPLDGTEPFILGLPLSVFMLGLSNEKGQLLLSVVYDPYSDKMYHAVKGQGAFCNNEPIHVSNEKIDEGYALIGPDSYAYATVLKGLSKGTQPVPGTGYKCMMIARGIGTGMINDSADFHDIGPGSLIIEEAGGKVTGLSGERLTFNEKLEAVIVSNSRAHDEFIKIAKATLRLQ